MYGWRPYLHADETLNDSDKSISVVSVPADLGAIEWQVQWIWVELTTTDDQGDRQLVIEIQDVATDVIGQIRAGVVQAASLTRYYMFSPQVAGMAAFIDTDFLTTPIPPFFLKQGDIIRIYDNNAVAVAADDMIVQIQYAGRSVD